MAFLKGKYAKSFNLYQVAAPQQKRFLELKVACYKPDQRPSDYYLCIKRTDEQMMKNSDFLRGKFNEVDVDCA